MRQDITPQNHPNSGSPSVNRYALLAEAVGAVRDYAIFVLDPDGYILTWNLGAERIKGYRESEIVGQHFSAFYTQEDLDRHHPEEELTIARREGRFEEDGWRVRKDGSKFWANVVITTLHDPSGKVMGFSKVTRDLTERRKSDEALRASEERFRQLVEGVKDYAIFLLDPKGIVATWNEGATRLNGYTSQEIIGEHFSKFYQKEDVESGKCEMELEEAALTGRYEDEGWRVRKDGTLFWANVVITSIRDSRGKVTGFTKITRDLTERRRAEERLRRANEELERRVKKRTAELTQAKEDLEKALQSRDEFLSIASHELKTPITSLKLQAQMLRAKVNVKDAKMPPPEKLEAGLNTVLRQTERLTMLVDYMLDVSRAHLGKFAMNFEHGDLSELVEITVKQWEEPLRTAGCALESNVEPAIFGSFDSLRLEQVLSNLLSNAIKYAPGKKVNVSLKKESGDVVLRVTDGGPGIDCSLKSRLFERFERGNAAAGVSGLGLGLYISKTIVEAHDGQISCESSPEKGTTFTVRLPLLSHYREGAWNQ